ncbi:helix-turn-helix domain-containing protein [Paenibacillus xylanilyticus]|uniref:helix-turn-helix domain-containing protein n=1 Tax=Paenibacillus xylanilyticus TaxID=248903 RepID=UPI001FE37E61|nr:helix-turn-helix domain-containing protein [Paenibacillus xylanilyticus]
MTMNQLKFDTGFFMAPNEIFDDIDTKTHEKLVYLYLCRCANNAVAFPSFQKIADKCSMSRRKAIDCVDWLIDHELLVKHTRRTDGINESNIYEILRPSAQHAPRVVQDMHQGSAQDAPRVVQDMHQGGAQDAPYKELSINNSFNKELDIKKDSVSPTEKHGYPTEFEEFWRVYPKYRKKDKAKTFTLWKKKIKAADRQSLIACTVQYASDLKTIGMDGEYSKAPSTYLNAESWKDYLPGGNDDESGRAGSIAGGSANANQYNENNQAYTSSQGAKVSDGEGASGAERNIYGDRSASTGSEYDKFVRR